MVNLRLKVSSAKQEKNRALVVLYDAHGTIKSRGDVIFSNAPTVVWPKGQKDALGEAVEQAFLASRFSRLAPHEDIWQAETIRSFCLLGAISDVERRKACEAAIREAAEAAKISL